jgi:MoaA/NifB/PqqE/SkfB family radical SAM enzyme
MIVFGSLLPQLRIAARLALGRRAQSVWGQIFLTRRCNLRCAFCAAPQHRSNDLPLAKWKIILQRLRQWGVMSLNIVGGEPTLHPDIWDFLSCAADLGFLTVLHSNLYKVQSDFEDRVVNSKVFALEASFDSLDGRRPRTVTANVDLLCRIRDRGVIPLVSTVMTSRNVDQVGEIARQVTRRRIVYLAAVYQSVGGVFSVNDRRLVPSQEQIQSAFAVLRKLKCANGLIRNSFHFLDRPELHQEPRWHCDPARDSWITVDSDGRLMVCQEHESPFYVLEVQHVHTDSSWRRTKTALANACNGCSYHCYFEAEGLIGHSFRSELAAYVRAYLACLPDSWTSARATGSASSRSQLAQGSLDQEELSEARLTSLVQIRGVEES